MPLRIQFNYRTTMINKDNLPKLVTILFCGIFASIILWNLTRKVPENIVEETIKKEIAKNDSLIAIIQEQKEDYLGTLDSLANKETLIKNNFYKTKEIFHEKLDSIYIIPFNGTYADSVLSSWKYKNSLGRYNY
jgi:hypothetical protein